MTTFTVTTAADVVNAGDGLLSLREAVGRANATAARDTIMFAPAVEGQTLTLSQREPIELTADVTIDGDRDNDGWRVTLDGGDRTLVVEVGGTGRTDVGLTDLAIANGGFYGQVTNYGGGGLRVDAGHALTMTRCAVTSCDSSYYGGGIFLGEGSSAVIRESLIRDNSSSNPNTSTGDYNSGGGIHAEGATLLLLRSTVADNAAAQRGGGIHVEDGVLRVVESTIVGNSAAKFLLGSGGGISAENSDTYVASSTITGNFAYNGYVEQGQYERGGGIAATGRLTLVNSIVAGNIAGELFGPPVYDDDVRGQITASNGHNIFGTSVAGAAAGDLTGVDAARLFAATDLRSGGGVLSLNGGATPTVRLRDAVDNPALGGAEPVAAGASDQRGEGGRPSPTGTGPDIGALELTQGAVSRAPSANNDTLLGTAGADALAGGDGADRVTGRGGSDRLAGQVGGDTLLGGPGDDVLDGGAGSDTASFRDALGAVTASLAQGIASGERGDDRLLRLENLEGGRFADRLEGDALANALGGGGGGDRLLGLGGADSLRGGDGDDLLIGGRGADTLLGGPGRDRFAFSTLADSAPGAATRDLVLDLGRGDDRLDLTAIDARGDRAGDQAFTFLAQRGATFTGAGQVRWYEEAGSVVVEASTDADRAPELAVALTGVLDLGARDFLL